MDRQTELAIVRCAYAKQIVAASGMSDRRLEAAFAAIPRENFVGPGPWQLLRFPSSYVKTPDDDPVQLYVDQVIALVPERNLNNGQPSLHAMLLAIARINAGDRVVHVGAGTGYYTAIMAHLAGPAGKVTAIECDASLAARARASLSVAPTVVVVEGNGANVHLDTADVIYVNAGVTRPAESWLDALSDGGRLIVPLTTDSNFPSTAAGNFDALRALNSGAFFLIRRCGTEFEARGLMPTSIYPAEGARDPASESALAAAFAKGGWNKVTRLVRGSAVKAEHCWLQGNGWCLTRS